MSKVRLTHEQPLDQELRYWVESGLEQGVARYERYLDLFALAPSGLSGQWVLDLGCGPFGGMFSVLEDVGRPFAVDVRAKTYNKWGLSNVPITTPDVRGKTGVVPGAIDSAFCLDVFGKTQAPRAIATELARVVRWGGLVYLFARITRGTKKYPAFRIRDAAKWFGPPPTDHGSRTPRCAFPGYWRWGFYGRGKDRVDLEARNEHAIWGILERT